MLRSARCAAVAAAFGALLLMPDGNRSADAGFVFTYVDPGGSGLSAEAEFEMTGASTLQIRLKNTSTGAPGGFDNADQLLTSVSFDLATAITGGSVMTGPSSASVNFSIANVGAGADVSGEWGFGSGGTTGLHPDFISTNMAGATQFAGANLDGPSNLDGPQGGLAADPAVIALGGIGAVQDEVIATVTLADPYTNVQLQADLVGNGTIVEFGSDAAFVDGMIPTPGGLAVLALGALATHRRRRPQR